MKALLSLSLLPFLVTAARAQTPGAVPAAQANAAMAFFSGGQLEWKDAPAAMPKGIKMAILEGDPTQPGPFTMRLRFPGGLRVPPHTHTQTEHATVISGVLHLGMGERFDSASTRTLTAGSFGFWAAGTKHFAWFEGETILQIHGQGPWTISYVNPADDPRNPS